MDSITLQRRYVTSFHCRVIYGRDFEGENPSKIGYVGREKGLVKEEDMGKEKGLVKEDDVGDEEEAVVVELYRFLE